MRYASTLELKVHLAVPEVVDAARAIAQVSSSSCEAIREAPETARPIQFEVTMRGLAASSMSRRCARTADLDVRFDCLYRWRGHDRTSRW